MTCTQANETELAPILKAYTEVTERLKRSHEALAREVCRLREELHQKNRELQRRERLAALGEMAAGIAHEIRNPLGGIGLYASMLVRDLADAPAQLEIVRKLSAGVANLESIIGDILAFAADAKPCLRPVCLGDVLADAVEQAANATQAPGVNIAIDAGLAEEVLHCDPALLRRAIVNLFVNAIEASGAPGRVMVRPDHDGDPAHERSSRCRIAVEDNGPGLSAAALQRVFEPFYTTKANGTGLGLALVQRIAQAHGGSVEVRNLDGGGAVFVLSIPRGGGVIHEERAA